MHSQLRSDKPTTGKELRQDSPQLNTPQYDLPDLRGKLCCPAQFNPSTIVPTYGAGGASRINRIKGFRLR